MEIFAELLRSFQPACEAYLFMWALAILGIAAVLVTLERWLDINRRTDYDAGRLFERLKKLVEGKKLEDAAAICAAAGPRALPKILGAGIEKFRVQPLMVADAMAAESTAGATAIERRLEILVMFGNVSTLLGLLGTVYGLIMAFTAVGQPDVAAVEKSSLLASGISTAMNSTLVGLSISIPCVIVYSFLRTRADTALQEIDRYAVALLNLLNPPQAGQKPPVSLTRRSREEGEVPDTDVTPMLNLMVMLIPFLLSSSEFVKIGAIELKLPESTQSATNAGAGSTQQETRLDLGIMITTKGFTLFHYFKADSAAAPQGAPHVDIPLIDGTYDYAGLNQKLADVKIAVLKEIIRTRFGSVPEGATLYQLYNAYVTRQLEGSAVFADHESIKIVAEEAVKYETVVAVMDAARGIRTAHGNVTMFPNVAIAGGVVQ